MGVRQSLIFLVLSSIAEILKILSSICTEPRRGIGFRCCNIARTCISIAAPIFLPSEGVSREFTMANTWKTFYLGVLAMFSNLSSTASRSLENDGSDSGFMSFTALGRRPCC